MWSCHIDWSLPWDCSVSLAYIRVASPFYTVLALLTVVKRDEVYKTFIIGGPRWPRGLRRGFVGVCLLGLRDQIPPRAWMSSSCEYCVLPVNSRGVLSSVLCRSEITEPHSGGLDSLKLSSHEKKVVPWACMLIRSNSYSRLHVFLTFFNTHTKTIFDASWKEVLGGWKKLLNEGHNIYFS